MRFIHFGQSCVLVDTGAARLLIDPGTWSAGFETVRRLDAILFTHHHFDHLDTAKLPALIAANPEARVIADTETCRQLDELGLRSQVVQPGEHLEIAGTGVEVVGGQHAVIHPDLPAIPNVGYVVDGGAFYHPGDSFTVPEQRIDVLGMPLAAPWLKISEAVDFLRAVAPRVAVPIHEALLAKPELFVGWLERLKPEGTELRVLPRGELVEV